MIALALSIALAHAAGPAPGLARAQATLSPGRPLGTRQVNIYVHGGADVYVSERVSLRGDCFYYIGEQRQRSDLVWNHSLLAGVGLHPMRGAFDPYLALQPGMALTRTDYEVDGRTERGAARLNPVVSAAAGANFYLNDHFHFFGEARQVAGRHTSQAPEPYPLHELRASFGLGFNARLWRGERRPAL